MTRESLKADMKSYIPLETEIIFLANLFFSKTGYYLFIAIYQIINE